MGNTYFKFKQFTIHQEHCAMKVCTDSCLFGAWIPLESAPSRLLDIGAGTGLLSLMLAQRGVTQIDAIEIDELACKQAKDNISQSPWLDSITLFHGDVRTYTTPHLYDLIISNPPFYEQSILSNEQNEQRAKHSTELTLDALLEKAVSLLSTKGKLALLLPYFRMEELISKAATYQLYPENIASIKSTPKHPFFRCMLMFGKMPIIPVKEEFPIKEESQVYSEMAIKLLHPFYLHL